MGQTYLSIQGSYQTLFIALYVDDKQIGKTQQESVRSSSLFISMLEDLLAANSVPIEDLDFIAVDQGPGAFTSLRVTITYINAISFDTHIPLVGVDGLAALADQTLLHVLQTRSQNIPHTIVTMLNAFGGEVYLGVHEIVDKDRQHVLESVVEPTNLPIDVALNTLSEVCGQNDVVISGNGSQLYRNDIETRFTGNASICADELPVCSVEQIAHEGLKIFNEESEHSTKILPLYLKEQTFAVRKK